jgi:deoxyribodipyrimidine photo-lyase
MTIVWFRTDLRLADHPALAAAARAGPVIPVFIWAPEEEGAWPPGGAGRWWLHQSLRALDADLRERGSRLILRRGPSLEALRGLVRAAGAGTVVWSRRHEPAARQRDETVATALSADGVAVDTFNAARLFDPGTILTAAGRPFQVFTPFWNACQRAGDPPEPLPAPGRLQAPARWPGSLPIEALRLEPEVDWATGLRAAWTPGERGAAARLDSFRRHSLADYREARNRPDLEGTSALSPHLAWGEIGPRQVWRALRPAAVPGRASGTRDRAAAPAQRAAAARDRAAFLRQLGWREFAAHLLHHFPHTADAPLRTQFARFPCRSDPAGLRAWQRGRTGYPIVDAAMRALWRTGWMHNRARMIVASFLVKDLLLSWREGARWFWDTLVDADLANNTLGWQWAAGCGADAAPYFRIFNPVLQGEKFDARGAYVRAWVPELARVLDEYLHRPWQAPAAAPGYPQPVVDHAAARERALAALGSLRRRGGSSPRRMVAADRRRGA